MSITIVRAALGVAALSLSLTPAMAQHEGHQMAGVAQASGGGAAMCAQKSEGVTRAIDVATGRIEEARQSNDASTLRAAVSDLQVLLAQMKTQLTDCVALTSEAGGGAMDTMGGMDHSKMQMAPSTPAKPSGSRPSASGAKAPPPTAGMDHSKRAATPPAKTSRSEPKKTVTADHSKMAMEHAAPAEAAPPSKAVQAPAAIFTLRTHPAPPRRGDNDFEVSVKDPQGKPIANADVSLAFYLPPMPSMKMPEMRNTVKLTPLRDGIYKGSGVIGMAGDWDVTLTISRNGQQLDARKMRLTVK